MGSPKSPQMIFICDERHQTAEKRTPSDNSPPTENTALSELSLVLLEHMPAPEVLSVVDQLRVLSADYRAGKMSESHFDRVAEKVIGTALVRNRKAVAA